MIVTWSLTVQPIASVTVTVYVAVASTMIVGDWMMEELRFAAGDQLYVAPGTLCCTVS